MWRVVCQKCAYFTASPCNAAVGNVIIIKRINWKKF